jgi:hypothetical protein
MGESSGYVWRNGDSCESVMGSGVERVVDESRESDE